MEITLRDAVTVIHGMGFGALLLLTFSGAAAGFYATSFSRGRWIPTDGEHLFFCAYLGAMAVLAWLAVFAGAYLVYPWYRAHATAGTTDLTGYPQRLLMSNPSTTEWHNIGMEWKEHIAWFAPIALTAVVYIFARYGRHLRHLKACATPPLASRCWRFSQPASRGFSAPC